MGALMVQGTCSGAGKSLLATALCRHFARRGVRVAPFKAQNMSNNARVVQGGEIGVAQYLQALAARVQPDVRMNPVLVKPESLTSSQVVVQGRVDLAVSALPWPEQGRHLWPVIEESLRSLLDEYELVVLEGAGSPAEINLADTDLANARTAHAADAPVLLVSDIDRGGAFAHLYGTWALIDRDLRQRIAGFVLNKFRGDPALLAPAPERLTASHRRADAGRGAVAGARPSRRGQRHDTEHIRKRIGDGGDRALPDGLQPRRVQGAGAGRTRALGVAATGPAGAPTSSCYRAPSMWPATWPGCDRPDSTAQSAPGSCGRSRTRCLRRPADARRAATRPRSTRR